MSLFGGILGKKKEEKPVSIDDLKKKFSNLQTPNTQKPIQDNIKTQSNNAQQSIQGGQQNNQGPIKVVEVEGNKQTTTEIHTQEIVDDHLEKVILEQDTSGEKKKEEEEKINKKSIASFLNEIKENYEDTKLINLIIDQIRELIEVDNNLNKKIKEVEDSVRKEINEREKLAKTIEKHYKEQKELEKNMNKFISLYELVTNKFNPFLEQNAPAPAQIQQQENVHENIIEQLKSNVEEEKEKETEEEPSSSAQDIFRKLKAKKEAQNKETQTTPAQNPQQTIKPGGQNTQEQSTPSENNNQDLTNQNIQSQNANQNQAAKPSVDHIETKKLPDHLHFQLKDGGTIDSLSKLLRFFKESTDQTIQEYVTHYKNDFAAWIYHVFHNEGLSKKLAVCKNRKELIDTLEDYIRTNHSN